MCAGCHGNNGISITNEFPNLAGQKLAYLQKQLHDFKAGKRQNATMNAMAQSLTTADIKDLATYFSFLPRQDNAVTKRNIISHLTTHNNASIVEFPDEVFLSMKASGTIEVLPSEKVVQGGENMLYTALTPNGKMLLSTSPSTNKVYIFNSQTLQKLAIIKVGKAPKGVKVTPDGKLAYVCNQGSNNISIINLSTLKNVGSIKTAAGPHNVRFTKNGKLAYVTLQGGAGIGVIDTKKAQITHVIPVNGITGPHNLDLSTDERIAYIRDFVHHVAIVDLTSEKVLKVLTVGNGHGGIDVFPNGKFVATAAIGDTFISVINTKTLIINNIELGTSSHGIRASKNNHWLYVTLPKENTIAVINTHNWQVEKKIAVGKFPFWLAVQGNP
jgi:YVTN family beta-propeller protein